MLIGVMVGALATTQIPSLKAASRVDWLAEFLYLPEVLYVVILVWLLLAGPGWLSLDWLWHERTWGQLCLTDQVASRPSAGGLV